MGSSGYPPEFVYYLIQAVQCLIFLAGFVAGILLLTRKRTLPGILALAAYFLLGLGAIAYIIIWDIILPTTSYSGGYFLGFPVPVDQHVAAGHDRVGGIRLRQPRQKGNPALHRRFRRWSRGYPPRRETGGFSPRTRKK